MEDIKYIDIAIRKLNKHIEILDAMISNTADKANKMIQERSDYIKAVEVLERIKEEKNT